MSTSEALVRTGPATRVDLCLWQLERAAEGGLNLDALTQDQCFQVWEAIHLAPVRAARLLFPEKPYGYVRATRNLRNYATNKRYAMAYREKGDIASAQMFERICQGIYERLPDFARW